ncbi:hypothetical protein [Brucella anthropi]|uniref:hypothetical protein n=1 Tax=Brucella anthropi TaxID=529 RepID=UPI00235F8ADA|nr:hypothetical protein [Brucella anthropi]
MTNPINQPFVLTEARCITGVSVKCVRVGDPDKPVLVQLRPMDYGMANPNKVLAEAYVPGSALVAGEFFDAEFAYPIYVEQGQNLGIVLMTDDPTRTVAVGRLGDVDKTGELISQQPFTVGSLQISSNGATVTNLDGTYLVCKIRAARFTETDQRVFIGDFTATKMSDLLVAAGVEYPETGTDVAIILKRPDGSEIVSSPSQAYMLHDYIQNEKIQVYAQLRGSDRVTPFVFPGVQVREGELQETADYETRAVEFKDASKVVSTIEAKLPSGSSVQLSIGVPGDFVTVSPSQTTQLGDGVAEQTYERKNYPEKNLDAKTRIVLTGTPAARPQVSNFRMWISKVS